MGLVEMLKDHSEALGEGVHNKRVRDLELKLSITIPDDFKEYLCELNYAELYHDPIYGIHPDDKMIDIYNNNKYKEHFRYGFLEVFSNDIDGTVFIRPDSGAVYDASYSTPIAKSFTDFVKMVLK